MTKIEKPGISVEQALEKLHKNGIDLKRQGLTRYLRSGEIFGYPPRADYPKEGWTVDVDSLQEFIDLKTMNINDMRKLVIKLRLEIQKLKGESPAEKVENSTDDQDQNQLSIEDVENEGKVKMEIGRTDIQNLKGLTSNDRKLIKSKIFNGVSKGDKKVIFLDQGQTLSDYCNGLLNK